MLTGRRSALRWREWRNTRMDSGCVQHYDQRLRTSRRTRPVPRSSVGGSGTTFVEGLLTCMDWLPTFVLPPERTKRAPLTPSNRHCTTVAGQAAYCSSVFEGSKLDDQKAITGT